MIDRACKLQAEVLNVKGKRLDEGAGFLEKHEVSLD
jgi:hypothetical protein